MASNVNLKSDGIKCCQVCRTNETLIILNGDLKWYNIYGKEFLTASKMSNIQLYCDLAIPFLGIYPRKKAYIHAKTSTQIVENNTFIFF